ncbi:hypothetical protein C1701_00255 [Actinoalloteichus sp. AHMU CJ021]|uniref:Uncharacterized protein n=1 Tax=Actinoalloteichus caeruleus DSM 43889 TaxID=1120930 RepID=A0ABT1JEC5_ACTCY|nr:hypothetical protein [Actinoalloteichus caeruleus]AUS77042.1 hypothetical protein C1701_00255 [Actinoalloteichus sp. AHMU CJ021]MCP2330848.1 hypothetical protein [Actinoalloteichus caeruleus DSM 43889]
MTRRTLIWPVVAFVVLIVELGATIGTVTGDPFTPAAGWGPTRPVDALAFAMVVLGCVALASFARFPLTSTLIATASYVVFIVRDHELGMFLPPMVAVLGLAAWARHRLAAMLCALASLAAAAIWVGHRTASIADSGVALLSWVAFGTVLAVFFLGPLLVGEIVRARSELREARASADVARA